MLKTLKDIIYLFRYAIEVQIVSDISQKAKDRSIQLFTYLREFIQQRNKVIRDFDSYEEAIPFLDIPKLNGCKCITWFPVSPDKDPAEEWIELRKPKRLPPPTPSKETENWIIKESILNSSGEPKLLSSIVIEEKNENDIQTKIINLSENPQIKIIFDEYVHSKWKPWAEVDKIEKEFENIYKQFFSIHQKVKNFSEEFELIIGFCLLKYQIGSQQIRRHILTTPATIRFDQKTGTLTILASTEGIKLSLEQDMLEVKDRPMPESVVGIEALMLESEDKIWDGISINELGKSYANAIPSGDGQYFESENHSGSTYSAKPQIYFSPYVILRKNSDRSLLKVYDSLIKAMIAGNEIPAGIMNILGLKNDDYEVSHRSEDNAGFEFTPLEIYFPLDSNREQIAIAEKLNTSPAVLVQGPPGTGKSHSIANLICHLLAQGKRILVTSHTTRALAVLKKKIPENIAPLCVELLGSDLTSMKSLEDSVYGILAKYNSWNDIDSELKIKKLKESLNDKKANYSSVIASLREIREKDIFKHVNLFDVYNGTVESIVRQLKQETDEYSWFIDHVTHETKNINEEMLLSYIDLYQKSLDLPPEIKNTRLPNLNDIQELKQLENLFVAEENIKSTLSGFKIESQVSTQVCQLAESKMEELLNIAAQIKGLLTKLNKNENHWHRKALSDNLNGGLVIWKRRYQESSKILEQIFKIEDQLPKKVMGLEGRSSHFVWMHVKTLLVHFYSGKGFGFWIFKPKIVVEAEFIFKEIYVDDISCRDVKKTLLPLERFLNAEVLLDEFLDIWEGLISFESKRQSIKITEAKDCIEQINTLFEIVGLIHKSNLILPIALKEKTISGVDDFVNTLTLISNYYKLNKLTVKIDYYTSLFDRDFDSEIVKDAVNGLKKHIQERDLPRILNSCDNIIELRKIQNALKELDEITQHLIPIIPQLLSVFHKAPEQVIWNKRFSKINSAISYKKALAWLKNHNDPTLFKQLSYQQESLRKEIQEITGLLAGELAWQSCFSNKSRFGDEQRESLNAWRLAVTRIGKGTGKFANKHRKDAKKHMESCRPAIPAWIMPMHKVAEVTKIIPDAFDVVILDEASQSGPEAIFLQYIGKQIVVVGDDKQISPDNVGLDRDGLYSIHQRYLNDIPRSDIIGPDNSFFDIADVRYGGRIRLREHFRCMPEIIQFSNNLCYSSEPLIPLKQFSSNRLTPVVCAEYIKDGFISGSQTKKINPSEVEAIVNKIETLIKNPLYKDKTFGVISLLGEWQSKEIEKRLIDRIGAEKIEKREIICGDAYAFQGDERDVMLLSLVCAVEEGKRIGALTKEKDKRRFNVAASRAKEQMFLFHSVTLNDLNPDCMRYKFLEYCSNPKVIQSDISGMNIENIRNLNFTADKSMIKPPHPFDSWFEVDVFLKIADQGFRVIPQYEVNGRRIDLVVEGMNGRLAVECDGDRWHGPDQYDQDMARQRDLERCGWVFFRVRGSDYAYSPDESLKDLWDTLKKMKITPSGESF